MPYIPYHSGSSSGEQAASPDRLFAPEAFVALALPAVDVFRVFFRTRDLRPNHRVTVRNATDGWERDIFGTYRDGAWVFEFERARYPAELEMKFVLDGTLWMNGFNVTVPATHDHHFDEGSVQFPGRPARALHGYDNLRTDESAFQQERIRSNLRSDIVYDVVVIGSGFGGGILADSLSDRGHSVLVLEAGGLTHPSHITNLPGDWPALPAYHQVGNFANESGSKFLFGVHMNLGGRSVYWSGLIPRMRDWELAFWPTPLRTYLTTTGYDAAEATLRKRRTLGPFQREAVTRLRSQFPGHNVDDLPQALHQPNIGDGDQLGNVLEKSTGVFSTADLLLDSLAYTGLAGRDNLTVNLNHYALRLVREGSRVTEVVCLDLVGNQERRYRGRVVVVAAGSLESPRIALRSGLPDPEREDRAGPHRPSRLLLPGVRAAAVQPVRRGERPRQGPHGPQAGVDLTARVQHRGPDQPEVLGRPSSRRRRAQGADRLDNQVERPAAVRHGQPPRRRQLDRRRWGGREGEGAGQAQPLRIGPVR